MIQTVNMPLQSKNEVYLKDIKAMGLDGIEAIWSMEEIPNSFKDFVKGYHLIFYPDWMDFFREDKKAINLKFGSFKKAIDFYGGTPDILLKSFKEDFKRAIDLKALYTVFHISDVSIEESYTYSWLHSDEEVIKASCEILNALLLDVKPDFDFLLENQWWPGFRFTNPALTEKMLDLLSYPQKGLLIDTGHLLSTNLNLKNQEEACLYILEKLKQHENVKDYIKGCHLHQSLSGSYVKTHTGFIPKNLSKDYLERYKENYSHILKIDEHKPWTSSSIAKVVEKMNPLYLTHELFAQGIETVKIQQKSLERTL